MKSSRISHKIIISGGGTGGHIYPAIAIADELKTKLPETQILFVGALGKMEMEKVPKAGYPIKGLPVSGFDRGNLFSNFNLPFKLIRSLRLSNKILNDFKPDLALGTGGYASGPLLWKAARKGIPVVIQEQNSFPGITNKLLKNKAAAICVAYEGISQFPADKTHYTGNPIRSEIFTNLPDRATAIESFGLNPDKKVILSIGGSQGSRTLNNAWKAGVEKLLQNDVQLLWQTGKQDFEYLKRELKNDLSGIHLTEFIYEMKTAFASADVIVSRAGAMAISELCLVGKPVILIPFPYAAEDHQTKNAKSLADKNAAIMISDNQAADRLVNTALDLVGNDTMRRELSENISQLGKPDATKEIVKIILSQIK
ncbi:MAG: undecaprenyldiphospho-muramoylpentapeptide beta-N-acetylglucosaminyltransferase [Weeksellaceae bacterium]|jgi:UDP-N-acetylglucosamine--N-acetylmuramyl-(pentapeptide) pyrophosphoryl-undecaprenol N-acetylglucosamine transferase|nr:undecaprenyldiphospho-muramoylpentapeptide beta-N-acetylglucosaminyltransferase [Weeksellaceae bacterium]